MTKKDMIGYCDRCNKKSRCKKLCSIAEEYVSQDNVNQKEFITSGNFDEEVPYESYWGEVNISDSATLKRCIIHLFNEGKSFREIAYHLSCNHSYAQQVVEKYKKAKNV